MEKVRLSGNYFSKGGKRFIPVGVNWMPSTEAMQWPYEWNPESNEADFAALANLGINFLRLDLVWGWFEPRPGQYNETAFEQLDYLLKLAHKYNIYLNPAFFIGGEVGDAYWDVPWRHGRHPHSDPDMLHLEAKHIAEFGRRYKDEPAIIAWDLTDEPPFWIVGDSTTDAMAANWTQLLCMSLRSEDQNHLIVCGNAAQEIGRGPFRIDNIKQWVDFASVHPYPIYESDLYFEPLLSTRLTYSAAYETKLCQGAGLPVLMQEFGASSAMFSPERQAMYYRTMIYSALASGNMGFIAWCSTDAHPQKQYDRAPYKRNPHETQFGIMSYSRTPRPHGFVMQEVNAVVDQLDLDDVEPAKSNTAIIVPHEWAKGADYTQYNFPTDAAYQYTPANILNEKTDPQANIDIQRAWLSSFILCRQAGLEASFPRELSNWQDKNLVLMPAPITNTGSYPVYVPFWQRVLPWVKTGGTLYASLSAMSALSIPDVVNLFGISLEDRLNWKPDISIEFDEDFHGIAKGEVFKFQAGVGLSYTGALLKLEGATQIAHDQNGNPAIVTAEIGKGHSIAVAYPIEMMLGITPNSFEHNTNYWRIYRMLKSYAGVSSLYSVENLNVEVSWLTGHGMDYVILVNHSNTPITDQVKRGEKKPAQITLLSPTTNKSIKSLEGSWDFKLEAFQGVVFKVEKR